MTPPFLNSPTSTGVSSQSLLEYLQSQHSQLQQQAARAVHTQVPSLGDASNKMISTKAPSPVASSAPARASPPLTVPAAVAAAPVPTQPYEAGRASAVALGEKRADGISRRGGGARSDSPHNNTNNNHLRFAADRTKASGSPITMSTDVRAPATQGAPNPTDPAPAERQTLHQLLEPQNASPALPKPTQ